MPTKPNTYKIRNKKYKSFSEAAGAAVDQSLSTGENITITEFNPNTKATFYIGVTAAAEEG
jgi:hypothetical protein